MNLITFKIKHRPHRTDETKAKISETMKQTGQLWKRYLELKPDGYSFDSCKQFRTYLKNTHDTYLLYLLGLLNIEKGDET